MSDASLVGKTRWYFNDGNDVEMFCGLCVEDNQVWMYADTKYIIKKKQDVVCFYCGWCPKKEVLLDLCGGM